MASKRKRKSCRGEEENKGDKEDEELRQGSE